MNRLDRAMKRRRQQARREQVKQISSGVFKTLLILAVVLLIAAITKG